MHEVRRQRYTAFQFLFVFHCNYGRILYRFYRATRMHSADYAVARCLSVRPSAVCLSHAGIVCKRLHTYFEIWVRGHSRSFKSVPLSMTLNDPYSSFKVTPFFDAEYLRNGTTYRPSVIEIRIGT